MKGSITIHLVAVLIAVRNLMKGSITILLLALLIATPVMFSNARADVLIGVKGGLTASDLWGGGSGEPFPHRHKMKAGFVGGVFFTYMTNAKFLLFENYGFQPELLFHRKGVTEVLMDFKITSTVDYLEIPILFKAEIPPTSNFSKGYLLMGPAFAFNLSAKQRTEVLGESFEEDISDITNNIDIGFVLGLSASFDIGSADLLLDLRYTFGIMDVDEISDEPARNMALSFMFGATMPFSSLL